MLQSIHHSAKLIIIATYLLHLQDYASTLRIIIAIYLLQCAPDYESQLHRIVHSQLAL